MQIKRSMFYLIIGFLMNTFVFAYTYAETPSRYEEKISNFNLRVQFFNQYCLEADGNFPDYIELPEKDAKGRATQFDCKKEANAIMHEAEVLSDQSANSSKEQALPCTNIQDLTNGQDITSGTLNALTDTGLEAADTLACSTKDTQGEERSCLKEAGCNAMRSLLKLTKIHNARNALNRLQSKIVEDQSRQNSCLDSPQSDCFTELVAGILKDLWSNIEGVWDIFKMATSWSKNPINSWHPFTSVEDKTADSAHAAGQQSESEISKFIKSPASVLKKIGESLYYILAKSIKETFMCAKWKGQPHLSKCLSPQTEVWSCATCNQKINSICGVVGFAAGEISTAYLTGGTLSLVKASAKVGGINHAITIVGKILPKLNKDSKAGKTSKFSKAKEFIKFKTSGINKVSVSVIDKAIKNRAVALAYRSIKIVTYPVVAYGKLMEQAAILGMQHGEMVVGGSTARAGTVVAVKTREVIQSVISEEAKFAKYKNQDAVDAYLSLTHESGAKINSYQSKASIEFFDKKLKVSSPEALKNRPLSTDSGVVHDEYYSRVFKGDMLKKAFPSIDPKKIQLIAPTTPPGSGARVYLIKNTETGEIIGAFKVQQRGGLDEILSTRAAERLLKERNPDLQIAETLYGGKLSGTDDYFMVQSAAKGRDLDAIMSMGTQTEKTQAIEAAAITLAKLHTERTTAATRLTERDKAAFQYTLDYELNAFDTNVIGNEKIVNGSLASLVKTGEISPREAIKMNKRMNEVATRYREIVLNNPELLKPTFVHGDAHGGNIFVDGEGKATLIDYGTLLWSASKKGVEIGDRGNDIGRMLGNLVVESLRRGESGTGALVNAKIFLAEYKKSAHIVKGSKEEVAFNTSVELYYYRFFGIQSSDIKGVKFKCLKNAVDCTQQNLRQKLFESWRAGSPVSLIILHRRLFY